METKPQTMTNEQLLHLAKMKAEHVLPQSQIRLTNEAQSLWLFNFGGHIFAGYLKDQPAPLLFKNREQYQMTDKTGKIIAIMQRLF